MMKRLLSALTVLVLPIAAHAVPIPYEFTIEAGPTASVSGEFTGSDGDGDGFIRDEEVTSLQFSIEAPMQLGPFNAVSIGTDFFTFNFDLTNNMFPTTTTAPGISAFGINQADEFVFFRVGGGYSH